MTDTTETPPCPVCGGPSEPASRPDFPLLAFGLIVTNRRCARCGHRFQAARGMTADERDRARAGRFAKTEAPDPAPPFSDGWDFL